MGVQSDSRKVNMRIIDESGIVRGVRDSVASAMKISDEGS